MDSGDNKKQIYQANRYTFPGFLDGGALAHAFMATNNQDEGENSDTRIIDFTSRQPAKVPPGSGDVRPDPATILLNLQLPSDIFCELSPLLERLEFGELSSAIEVNLFGEKRSYTCLQSNNSQNQWRRYLTYIPEEIITDANDANRAAIHALGQAFEKDAFLVILYRESSGSPDYQIQTIIEDGWDRYKWRKLVSWEQIQKLKSRDAETQKAMLRKILGLNVT